jgi:XamI restriction endonuclease
VSTKAPKQPPRWSQEQLESDRVEAIEIFRAERMQEPLEQYHDFLDHKRGKFEDLLETTLDLTRIVDQAVDVLSDADLLEAVRYLAGPPISLDDLKVLSETNSLSRRSLAKDPGAAKRVIETVLLGLDRRRFPWIGEDREPDEGERSAAALASAAMIASRQVMTKRANESKAAQEQAVADRLKEVGFAQTPAPQRVPTLDHAPGPGQFCGETTFGERKADLLVGLWDGRTMPLECKVSNSATNSIKRLNNDAAVKAGVWIQDFGRLQVVPAAVLSGVYHRHHLENAQDRGLTLYWAHDLNQLTRWIDETRS